MSGRGKKDYLKKLTKRYIKKNIVKFVKKQSAKNNKENNKENNSECIDTQNHEIFNVQPHQKCPMCGYYFMAGDELALYSGTDESLMGYVCHLEC